jgi:hypothetical protein
VRERFHPADEFEAFRALIDDGTSIPDVAARFGIAGPLLSAISAYLRLSLRRHHIRLPVITGEQLIGGRIIERVLCAIPIQPLARPI